MDIITFCSCWPIFFLAGGGVKSAINVRLGTLTLGARDTFADISQFSITRPSHQETGVMPLAVIPYTIASGMDNCWIWIWAERY